MRMRRCKMFVKRCNLKFCKLERLFKKIYDEKIKIQPEKLKRPTMTMSKAKLETRYDLCTKTKDPKAQPNLKFHKKNNNVQWKISR